MNIALIGMSGAGKSYIGRLVAEQLGLTFVDIDELIEAHAGKSLSEVIMELGDEAFVRVEAAATEKACDGSALLISTGGSVVYSEETMEALRERSRVIYLQVSKETLIERIAGNRDREGRIVGLKNKSLSELIDERIPLYEAGAHVVVHLDDTELDEAVARVVNAGRS